MWQMFSDKARSAQLIYLIQAKPALGDPSCEMCDASQVMLQGLCGIALLLKVRTKLGNVRLQNAVFQPCPCLSRNYYFIFHDDLLGIRNAHTRRPPKLCAARSTSNVNMVPAPPAYSAYHLAALRIIGN